MEALRAELSAALGEPIGRMEQISEQPYAYLYALYTRQGAAIPLVAKSYLCAGVAQQEAYKLSMLARQGTVRLPAVFGVLTTCQAPFQEILLIERLRGVAAEAPARNPARWESLKEQIVEGCWRGTGSIATVVWGMSIACRRTAGHSGISSA